MKPSSSRLHHSGHAARVQAALSAPAMSSGFSSGTFSRPFDLWRFRAVFPDRWSSLLQRHHRDSEEIAFFYGVDEKTARNWLEGATGPRGAHVAMAFEAYPVAAMTILLGAA